MYSYSATIEFLSIVPAKKMTILKIVIDTDAGIDDAAAIMMALEAHKRGITTSSCIWCTARAR